MLSPGDIVGDYEVLDELSSGGMGTLFLGRRSGVAGFERRVAIKVIHPHLARDRAFVRLFVDEALLAAQIHHPNVVHVDELREWQGTYFQVMEFVAGCSLAQLMRALVRLRRRMVPAAAVAIVAQVAEGLHAAHETPGRDGEPLGVVHRDVSPQNVLLGDAGQVKLIDFGVAKARGRERTQTGHLRGKLRYMAPEQTHAGPVDRRADVYALGAVLWEMLTLQRLHETDNEFELLARVRSPRLVPPGARVEGISAALDAVVMSALHTDPSRRPPDARAFRTALFDALPEAMAVDAPRLAALLALVATGRTGDGTDTDATPVDALGTCTVSVADGSAIGFDDGDEEPPSLAAAITPGPALRDGPTSPATSTASTRARVAWPLLVLVAATAAGIGIGIERLVTGRVASDGRAVAQPSAAAPLPSMPRPVLAPVPSPPAVIAPPEPVAHVASPAVASVHAARIEHRHARAVAHRQRLVHGVPLAVEVTR